MEDTDYEKKYNNDVNIYKEYLVKINVIEADCTIYETPKHPMHPHLFYQLSCVNGFNYQNGDTYKKYLNGWEQRYECVKNGLKL
jgi:hypothetical protein